MSRAESQGLVVMRTAHTITVVEGDAAGPVAGAVGVSSGVMCVRPSC
jgi:hypothetical protein